MSAINTVKKIHNTISQHMAKYNRILVAFSGGVDSTVLLHALSELNKSNAFDLKAIYIHHGLSLNADSWAQHCQQICQDWHIPMNVIKVQLTEQGNVEAQAREARYTALRNQLLPQQVLCTAQHLDDQAETFLLALKRGSGPAGLSSMSIESPFSGTKLIRPLLAISRAEIEAYAEYYQLTWIEDESNLDEHYDRNFLRCSILPKLNQRWPHLNQMIARSAELCGEQQQLLDEYLSIDLAEAMDSDKSLSIVHLQQYSEIKRNALLRIWLKNNGLLMPTRLQLSLIWQNVALAKMDAEPEFKLDAYQVRRYQQRLFILPHFIPLTDQIIDWDLDKPLPLPDNLGQLFAEKSQTNGFIRLPLPNEKVTVRFGVQGRFDIVGRHGSRPIKKLWQEFNVPPWQRQRVPLVYYNETLIAAVNLFVTVAGKGNIMTFIQK